MSLATSESNQATNLPNETFNVQSQNSLSPWERYKSSHNELPFKYIYALFITVVIIGAGLFCIWSKFGSDAEDKYYENYFSNTNEQYGLVEEEIGVVEEEIGVVEEEIGVFEVDEISLPNIFSNNKFSIRYPYSWEIVQQNTHVLKNTTIDVQIMQKSVNDYDFRPNINIIVSKDKHQESTSYLARNSYMQSKARLKGLDITTSLIGIRDCMVGGCYGSVAEYTANLNGYSMHIFQYVVKKKDNTTMIITLTLDQNNLVCQKEVGMAIINSIEIF